MKNANFQKGKSNGKTNDNETPNSEIPNAENQPRNIGKEENNTNNNSSTQPITSSPFKFSSNGYQRNRHITNLEIELNNLNQAINKILPSGIDHFYSKKTKRVPIETSIQLKEVIGAKYKRLIELAINNLLEIDDITVDETLRDVKTDLANIKKDLTHEKAKLSSVKNNKSSDKKANSIKNKSKVEKQLETDQKLKEKHLAQLTLKSKNIFTIINNGEAIAQEKDNRKNPLENYITENDTTVGVILNAYGDFIAKDYDTFEGIIKQTKHAAALKACKLIDYSNTENVSLCLRVLRPHQLRKLYEAIKITHHIQTIAIEYQNLKSAIEKNNPEKISICIKSIAKTLDELNKILNPKLQYEQTIKNTIKDLQNNQFTNAITNGNKFISDLTRYGYGCEKFAPEELIPLITDLVTDTINKFKLSTSLIDLQKLSAFTYYLSKQNSNSSLQDYQCTLLLSALLEVQTNKNLNNPLLRDETKALINKIKKEQKRLLDIAEDFSIHTYLSKANCNSIDKSGFLKVKDVSKKTYSVNLLKLCIMLHTNFPIALRDYLKSKNKHREISCNFLLDFVTDIPDPDTSPYDLYLLTRCLLILKLYLCAIKEQISEERFTESFKGKIFSRTLTTLLAEALDIPIEFSDRDTNESIIFEKSSALQLVQKDHLVKYISLIRIRTDDIIDALLPNFNVKMKTDIDLLTLLIYRMVKKEYEHANPFNSQKHHEKISALAKLTRLYLCVHDSSDGYKKLFEHMDYAYKLSMSTGNSPKSKVLALTVIELRTHLLEHHPLDNLNSLNTQQTLLNFITESTKDIQNPDIKSKLTLAESTKNFLGRVLLLSKYISALEKSGFHNIREIEYDLVQAIFTTKEKLDYPFLCYQLSKLLTQYFSNIYEAYQYSPKTPKELNTWAFLFNYYAVQHVILNRNKNLIIPDLVSCNLIDIAEISNVDFTNEQNNGLRKITEKSEEFANTSALCIIDITTTVDIQLIRDVVNCKYLICVITDPESNAVSRDEEAENYYIFQKLLWMLGYPLNQQIGFNDCKNDVVTLFKKISDYFPTYNQAVLVTSDEDFLSKALNSAEISFNILASIKPNVTSNYDKQLTQLRGKTNIQQLGNSLSQAISPNQNNNNRINHNTDNTAVKNYQSPHHGIS